MATTSTTSHSYEHTINISLITLTLSILLIAVTSALIATCSSIKTFQQPVKEKKRLQDSQVQTDR
eukprot:1735637-Amphidinium_carterae.1